jgi:hypothetical protein
VGRRRSWSVWPITVSPAPSISAPSGAIASASRSKAEPAHAFREIEQHVAAQDDVELPGPRRPLADRPHLEAHHVAEPIRDLPLAAALVGEPADHLGDRQPRCTSNWL